MERTCHLLMILALSTTCRAQAPSQWWWFMEDTLERYAYAGGDEFSGSTLDRDMWMTSFDGRRNHHGTHMQEYNTDGSNFVLGDGTLKIQLRKESIAARGIEYEPDDARLGDGGPNRRTWNYTSGLLVSKQAFQFGLFEARIRSSKGRGAWPSFWLFGGQPNEEFDILEGKGEKPEQFHVDVHCPGHACDDYRNPIGGFGRWLGINWKGFGMWKKADGDLSADFNDYLGEWRPDVLRWYLNGEQCAEWKGALLVPERLLLQNAMANTCKGCPFGPGPEAGDTVFTDMVVDHVRIWRALEENEWLGTDTLPRLTMDCTPGITIIYPTDSAVTIERWPERIGVRGGRKGKTHQGFRVKTFLSDENNIRLEVQGRIPNGAYLELNSGEQRVIPRQKLSEGIVTVSLEKNHCVYTLIVGDGTREAKQIFVPD